MKRELPQSPLQNSEESEFLRYVKHPRSEEPFLGSALLTNKDILCYIFAFLTFQDQCAISRVCRTFRTVIVAVSDSWNVLDFEATEDNFKCWKRRVNQVECAEALQAKFLLSLFDDAQKPYQILPVPKVQKLILGKIKVSNTFVLNLIQRFQSTLIEFSASEIYAKRDSSKELLCNNWHCKPGKLESLTFLFHKDSVAEQFACIPLTFFKILQSNFQVLKTLEIYCNEVQVINFVSSCPNLEELIVIHREIESARHQPVCMLNFDHLEADQPLSSMKRLRLREAFGVQEHLLPLRQVSSMFRIFPSLSTLEFESYEVSQMLINSIAQFFPKLIRFIVNGPAMLNNSEIDLEPLSRLKYLEYLEIGVYGNIRGSLICSNETVESFSRLEKFSASGFTINPDHAKNFLKGDVDVFFENSGLWGIGYLPVVSSASFARLYKLDLRCNNVGTLFISHLPALTELTVNFKESSSIRQFVVKNNPNLRNVNVSLHHMFSQVEIDGHRVELVNFDFINFYRMNRQSHNIRTNQREIQTRLPVCKTFCIHAASEDVPDDVVRSVLKGIPESSLIFSPS